MPSPIRSFPTARPLLWAAVFAISSAVAASAADDARPAPAGIEPPTAARPAAPPAAPATSPTPAPTTAAPPTYGLGPLVGVPRIDPAVTGPDVKRTLATMLPPRDDSPRDWQTFIEPLHAAGEPRALPPCVPPPPCHPADPAVPFDLVGVAGVPSCGPIYRGPCAPRSATVHTGPFRWVPTLHDRFFDHFYRSR